MKIEYGPDPIVKTCIELMRVCCSQMSYAIFDEQKFIWDHDAAKLVINGEENAEEFAVKFCPYCGIKVDLVDVCDC